MPLITIDDIIDTYSRFSQRGSQFVFSKLTFIKKDRTKSAFNKTAIQSSNWWMIPMVKQRWNSKISGNPNIDYKEYLMTQYFEKQTNIRLLSLGSGSCGHELELAKYSNFKEIVCVDLAANRLKEAEESAKNTGLTNMKFICADIKDYSFPEKYFDLVLFNSSLHHFDKVNDLLKNFIKPCLKTNGHLIINEYVGPSRLQFPKHQIKSINVSIDRIPKKYRMRFKTNHLKKRFYGSGLWRMVIADPSECIDSASILPSIHQYFKIIDEKPYGGNILMNTLKDISHHFMEIDNEKEETLKKLFEFEDDYLKDHPSDFVFGIYAKS